jgi:hypothetical protein
MKLPTISKAIHPRVFLSLLLCTTAFSSPSLAETFAGKVEKAHGANSWRSAEAVKTDIAINFGGKLRLEGEMLSNTEASKSHFKLKNGSEIVFDGTTAWLSPADDERQRARFDALTWPYFLAAPFKLNDPGTQIEELGQKSLFGKVYETAKLTFSAGVGDSPDDWYILYRDPESSVLKAMAYIVTYGSASKKKEKEPHVIVYDAFEEVGGVKLATDWKFYNWSEDKGAFGEVIGFATLKNLSFEQLSSDAFAKPENAREDALP